jgi:hypothetical protein
MSKTIVFKTILLLNVLLLSISTPNLAQQTPYELQGKNYTATYKECMEYYRELDDEYNTVSMVEMGMTDAGLPLNLVVVNANGQFDPELWHKKNQVVILINNGIHPGEPDGIDASMMLVRDLAQGKLELPENVSLAFIPVYNIGGCLNRSEYNRVDQNGPTAFGSRGNSQNLDLNRDFIKCDSKEARSFAELFQWLNPDVFIDNHVSDGADYPYIMTLATSQHNKLGGEMGTYMNEVFEPALFNAMKEKENPIMHYVNVWGHDAKKGWSQFFDSPRYSTGYATLFHTFGFTPETHMLKPYDLRVNATYQLMECIFNFAAANSDSILSCRKKAIAESSKQQSFPLNWTLDTSLSTKLEYRGYAYKTKTSLVSNLPIQYYDRQAPYTTQIDFQNYYKPTHFAEAPEAYIIPQGWWKVIELLKINQVDMQRLNKDSLIEVESYTILNYKSSDKCYENHHANSNIKVDRKKIIHSFRKGDYVIPVNQLRKRFIVEVLEPEGNDSYFAWNYFDAILVQKEGYSAYAYEDYAAQYLKEHPELKEALINKRQQDPKFAASASEQLEFVYKQSPYYEKGHNLYPVFRLKNVLSSTSTTNEENVKEIRNKVDE